MCERASATIAGNAWGPCRDVKDIPGCTPPCDCAKPIPACEDYCKARDAGADSPPAKPVCVPSLKRWCHLSSSCLWGRQVCLPDGTWGACEETSDPRPPGCEDLEIYSACCCVMGGGCCEDDRGYYDPFEKKDYKDGSGPSVGSCADPPSCPGAGYCYPGKRQYCPVAGKGWGIRVCGGDGAWGPCAPTERPSLDLAHCPGEVYGAECCYYSMLCCESSELGICKGWCNGIVCKK